MSKPVNLCCTERELGSPWKQNVLGNELTRSWVWASGWATAENLPALWFLETRQNEQRHLRW